MTNMDPVMEQIFTVMIPCPGVGILKMIPCSAARPRTERYMSTPSPPGLKSSFLFIDIDQCVLKYRRCVDVYLSNRLQNLYFCAVFVMISVNTFIKQIFLPFLHNE